MVRADTPAMPWVRMASRAPSISRSRVSAIAGILAYRLDGGGDRGDPGVHVGDGEAPLVPEERPEARVGHRDADAEPVAALVVPLTEVGLAGQRPRARHAA